MPERNRNKIGSDDDLRSSGSAPPMWRGMVGAPRRLRITRRRIHAVLAGIVAAATVAPASAQQPAPFSGVKAPPFTATLSNTTPLAFGMDAEDAARALGMPLHYISGRPGDEIYLVFRPIGGSGFFNRSDRLFLQFRRGQLAGWKGDWGRNWMWH